MSPVFVFNGITPSATVDEGNNWINLTYGPLSLFSAAGQVMLADASVGTGSGAYSIPSSSPAVNAGSNSGAPDHDFFNNPRPRTTANRVDIGAVEVVPVTAPAVSVAPASLAFGTVNVGSDSTSQTLTLTNSGSAALNGLNVALTGPFTRSAGGCGATLNAGANCSITVVFHPAVVGAASGSVAISGSNGTVTGSPVGLNGTGAVLPPAAASASPNPLTITIPARGLTATGTVTMQNTAAAGSQSFTISGVSVSGTGFANGPLAGPDTCSGTTLTPQATCTVVVRFTRLTGTGTRTGTLTFTDNAPGNPHVVNLQGVR